MHRYIPLSQPYLGELEIELVSDAVRSGWLTQAGSYVSAMENLIAEHTHDQSNRSYEVTSTSNGTTALHLVLLSMEIGEGDEVIVPDFGYIAPVNAVLMCGATPVVVDVDIETWCVDPGQVASAITRNTRAVIAVDNYGQFSNVQTIRNLVPNHVLIVQDSAESFPSLMKSPENHFIGDFITTSFYANKVITTAEGGAISGPRKYVEKIKSLKNQSVRSKGTFEHIDIGYNYRLSNLHAALFKAQWERLPEILEQRIRVFENYFESLAEEKIQFESNQFPVITNPWLMTIRLPGIEKPIAEIREFLATMAIETRPGFKPASKHAYLEGRIRTLGNSQNSNLLHNEIISLPTYPELTDEEIKHICKTLRQAIEA